jgi:hypothetical protein
LFSGVWRGWVLGNEALFDDLSSRQHALIEDSADDNTIGLRRLGNVHPFRRYLPDVAAYFFKDITVCDPALFSGLKITKSESQRTQRKRENAGKLTPLTLCALYVSLCPL